MFLKTPTPRKFEYICKFYKPEQEEEKHIKFRRIRKSPPAKKGNVLRLVILLFVLALMFYYLQRQSGTSLSNPTPSSGTFKVEEVIVVD